MTEEQIKDGYERLDSALHAPQDAFARVEKRMASRRRHRRAGIAVGTTVAVAAVGGYVAVSSGGSDAPDSNVVAVEPPPSVLVMTRPDGSTYEFRDLEVSCAPSAPFADGFPTDGSLVAVWSPMRLDGERLEQPFVFVTAAVTEQSRDYTFPLDENDATPLGMPIVMFIGDTEGAPDGNEVVSSGGSTGTARVVRASCDPTPVLELEVDVTLASEEQTEDGKAKQSLVLEGALR